jgi:hypothetical protein
LKRSGGKSSQQPPEEPTFFIEAPLGKAVGLALREAGLKVVLHTEVLPQDAEDVTYLKLCAENGWIIFTADGDVHNKPNQRILIASRGLRVFRLTRNHWPWPEKLNAFRLAVPQVLKLARNETRPFIARIDKQGRIGTVDFLT